MIDNSIIENGQRYIYAPIGVTSCRSSCMQSRFSLDVSSFSTVSVLSFYTILVRALCV